MGEPYIGEIRPFAFSYVPEGWALCDGRTLPTRDYQALYSVIGTTYGGDDQAFAVPNLNGRVPLGASTAGTYKIGGKGGAETVTLGSSNIPTHIHQLSRKSPVSATSKVNVPSAAADIGVLAEAATNTPYKMMGKGNLVNSTLGAATISSVWSAVPQAHTNMQPYLPLCFGIAVFGIYPVAA